MEMIVITKCQVTTISISYQNDFLLWLSLQSKFLFFFCYYIVTKLVEDNVEIKLLNMAERMEVS